MDTEQIKESIAYCGLLCLLCQPDGGCNCRSANQCPKKLSPNGCHQFECCTAKGLHGCWECPEAPCGMDMHATEKIKIRAFIRCIREDGLDTFSEYIANGLKNGLKYHRNGIRGDYDLESEEAVLQLLRESRPITATP